MVVDQFVATFDNVVSPELCEKMIKWFDNYDESIVNDPAKLVHYEQNTVRDGGAINGRKNRKDVAYFLNIDNGDSKLCQDVRRILYECCNEYLIEFPQLLGHRLSSNALKIQRTEPHGGYHVWHHESGPTQPERKLVWTMYLNDLPEGEGETEFLFQGIRVQPKTGTVCIFPAGFTHTHRGNPPYTKSKYIVTGWFHSHGVEEEIN